jgi:hypothetical protein
MSNSAASKNSPNIMSKKHKRDVVANAVSRAANPNLRASRDVTSKFMDSMKKPGRDVSAELQPCRSRTVKDCERRLYQGIDFKPCKIVQTQHAAVCDYNTMPNATTVKKVNSLVKRSSSAGTPISTIELRKQWASEEFRPTLIGRHLTFGKAKIKMDRGLRQQIKQTFALGKADPNKLLRAKQLTKAQLEAIQEVYGDQAKPQKISANKLGTEMPPISHTALPFTALFYPLRKPDDRKKYGDVPSITAQTMQCGMMSARPGTGKKLMELKSELCVVSGACERSAIGTSGAFDCVPSEQYVVDRTSQKQRDARKRQSQAIGKSGLPSNYPKTSEGMIGYLLNKNTRRRLVSADKSPDTAIMQVLSDAGEFLPKATVSVSSLKTGLAKGFQSVGEVFYQGPKSDENEPRSCRFYTPEECPQQPLSDGTGGLYFYGGRSKPVIGHCNLGLKNGVTACVSPKGMIAGNRAVPTYETLLNKTSKLRPN